MKKIMTLLLAAGLVFSAANGASAVEVKASGTMDFAFDYGTPGNHFMSTRHYDWNQEPDERNGINQEHNKRFSAVQRLRLNLEFVASENLSGHYQAQVGTFTWGGPAQGVTGTGGNSNEANGGALGTRAANIVTRLAYLDWMIPNTDVKVRMGQQAVAMPSYAFASPVLDDTATGIMISAPITENIGLTGGWLRAYSSARRGSDDMLSSSHWNDTFDLFTVVANFKYDGFQVSPWVLMGPLGKNADNYKDFPLTPDGDKSFIPSMPGMQPMWGSGRPIGKVIGGSVNGPNFDDFDQNSKLSNSFVWFAGLGGELTMFDPFRFALDFYYSANDTGHSYSSRSGWYVGGSAEYKTAYGTPALKAWYSTGDDKKVSNGSERPLSIAGAFNPTLNYFDGRYGIANTIDVNNANGTWGVGLHWNGLSFVENLTHDFGVTYFRGTNNKWNLVYAEEAGRHLCPVEYMTTKDAAVELDFTSTYNIYKNLATVLELSYIFQDFDGKTWGEHYEIEDINKNILKAKFDNVFRVTLNFRYTF